MANNNLSTKERGEQWALAQREKLRQSTFHKAEQLLKVYQQHIAWLRAHPTAESFIELRRPLKRVHEEIELEDEIQLVQSSRHCTGDSSRLQRSLTASRSGQHRSMLSNHLKTRSPSNSSMLSTTETSHPPPPPPPPEFPEEDQSNKLDTESDEIDPDFILSNIPSWAQSPELISALSRQSVISGDQVFGPIKPVATSDVFGSRRITHRI
ncbi:hypothetical protein BX666DRAFT_2030846 [Dichotomocladium elegans]|nr:hypothetical protein BX666DRAFT_2030846 [Dichotomocladium elegans]